MWSTVTSSVAVHLLVICLWTVVSVLTADPCPYAQYVQEGEQHIMCLPPNTACKILAKDVSQTDQDLILTTHNKIRNTVAAGQQTIANGAKLPQAADMRLLVWKPELATIAQAHANQCLTTFECFNCRSTYDYTTGEILYMTYHNSQPPKPEWQKALNYWASGAKQTTSADYSQNRPFAFTQMIWGQTKDIGCGYSLFRGSSTKNKYRYTALYVCIYGPAGNYRDQATYEVGPPCSDCSTSFGESCCADSCTTPLQYSNLCQMPKDGRK